MLLIAQQLVKSRNLSCSTILQRATYTTQRSATAKQRIAQAKKAFRVRGDIDKKKVYLLVDDVITTGATVTYATLALQSVGASTVWVASISRQPLD